MFQRITFYLHGRVMGNKKEIKKCKFAKSIFILIPNKYLKLLQFYSIGNKYQFILSLYLFFKFYSKIFLTYLVDKLTIYYKHTIIFVQKEDAECALRARDMQLDEAVELLSVQRSNSIGDGWRARHDEHFDHQNSGPFPTQRFGPSAQMPFPPSGNTNSASNNPPLASINSMSPAIVQRMLNQSQSSQVKFNYCL